MAERMTGGQAVVAALEANGVDVVFGIPGVHTLAIYRALLGSNIRHILARHEQGAGFMADGYARATGRPGVAIIITGPGLTNVSTPIGEAYADSSPVLVVSAENPKADAAKMRGHLHDLHDQLGLMRHLTKWNTQVDDPAAIPAAINEAFTQMRSGRPRPTHVQIPLDVLAAEGDVSATPAPEGIREHPDDATIQAAAAIVRGAHRVVLYVGGGAAQSEAAEAVAELAALLGAPVITNVPGKTGIMADSPYFLGTVFYGAAPAIHETLSASEIGIVIGSKLGAQSTSDWTLPLPKRLIHIDIDPAEPGRNYPAEVKIVGDARLACELLADAVRAGGGPAEQWSEADIAAKRVAVRRESETAFQPYIDALRDALPHDGIITHDMTTLSYMCHTRFPVYAARSYYSPHGFGTLGFSVPAAIGAKIGRPEREVVAVVGDGGYHFTMEELAVAIQYRVTLPIVIFNDRTYTAVKRGMDDWQGYIGVDLVNPDYLALAAAYGVPGVRVSEASALASAIREAQTRPGPTLIDVPISSPRGF